MNLDLDRNNRHMLYLLVTQAVQIESVHHKQWYLISIAEVLGIDLSEFEVEEGIAP